MFHYLINFSVVTFICYAAAYPAGSAAAIWTANRNARAFLIMLPPRDTAPAER